MEEIDHRAAMDLMTGTMGRLLHRLGEVLKQEHNLQTSTSTKQEDFDSFERELRRMHAALCNMSWAHVQADQLDPEDSKNRAYELRELSCDIEDIIDILLLRFDTNHDNFREILEDIKLQVVKNLAASHAGAFVATTSTVGPCLDDDVHKGGRRLIGIHKLRAMLISRISSSHRLTKLSIWGAGGMGKTTLAKSVYENIKGDFEHTAFVSVGPQPGTKKTLRDILIHLDKKRYNDLNMAMLVRGQLIDELRHFLENKRSLIVIDGIRDILSWKVIKYALVDSGCGSRIITTSRVLDVAQSSGDVLKLMPLSIDRSKELFYAIFCGRKDTTNYDALDEQTTEYIVQKCGCVPLAIIMIASLMAGKPQEEWTEVYNSIRFGHKDDLADENNTRKIIQFSYCDLPRHLKTCLLYLSIFPYDHVIEENMLVWRWVAEGFVHDEQQGESLFKVGERYLYELVSRSMIRIVENEDTNKRGCCVESMVLDWICTVAKEENFVNAVSGNWYGDHDHHLFFRQSNNAPIMAVHDRVLANRTIWLEYVKKK